MSRTITAVRTTGGCMRPLISSDSMIIVIKDDKPYKPGEVILFDKDGKKFVHRILSLQKNGFITADDAGLTRPVFITFDSVIGRCAVSSSASVGVIYGYLSRLFFRFGRFMKNLISCYANTR